MSRSFLYYFKYFFNSSDDIFTPKQSVSILGCTIVGHFAYALGTKKKKEIKIVKKYTFTKNGYTDFMVIDSYGNHYNINNSLWYWKWDSIEDWNSIETNKKLNMKYYGWRVPILGIFPNIVSTQNNKNNNNNNNTKINDIIVKDMSLEQDLSDGKFS